MHNIFLAFNRVSRTHVMRDQRDLSLSLSPPSFPSLSSLYICVCVCLLLSSLPRWNFVIYRPRDGISREECSHLHNTTLRGSIQKYYLRHSYASPSGVGTSNANETPTRNNLSPRTMRYIYSRSRRATSNLENRFWRTRVFHWTFRSISVQQTAINSKMFFQSCAT